MLKALRICLADDHPVVLAGVRAQLERFMSEVEIVAEARDGRALLALLAQDPGCDVVITDFSMPTSNERGCDGIPLLQALRRQWPSLRIVVLTMIENPALLQAMLDTGIHGLVDKASPIEELQRAVRSAVDGRRYVSRELRNRLQADAQVEGTARLSPHEAEVVRLFVHGLTVTAIAERLSRSVKTISRQKNDAMRKLGVDNHSQLYAYAREHGLAP